jgi:hypothetical protein
MVPPLDNQSGFESFADRSPHFPPFESFPDHVGPHIEGEEKGAILLLQEKPPTHLLKTTDLHVLGFLLPSDLAGFFDKSLSGTLTPFYQAAIRQIGGSHKESSEEGTTN